MADGVHDSVTVDPFTCAGASTGAPGAVPEMDAHEVHARWDIGEGEAAYQRRGPGERRRIEPEAGLARIEGDATRLDEALSFYRDRPRLNCDDMWFDREDATLVQPALAAARLGRDEAGRLLDQARALGSYEATRIVMDEVRPAEGWAP